MELLGFLTGLGLLKQQYLIYPRLFTEFSMLVFFTNFLFSQKQTAPGGSGWKFSQEYLVNAEVPLKAPFLPLNFSYYKLMTSLIKLSVILLFMLMILLTSLSVMKHLICGNSQNWFLNLNLIYKTLWTRAGSVLLISILEKLNWFHLTGLITLVLLMGKWMGLSRRKNNLLRCWGWLSLLNWIGGFTLFLFLRLSSRKLEP